MPPVQPRNRPHASFSGCLSWFQLFGILCLVHFAQNDLDFHISSIRTSRPFEGPLFVDCEVVYPEYRLCARNFPKNLMPGICARGRDMRNIRQLRALRRGGGCGGQPHFFSSPSKLRSNSKEISRSALRGRPRRTSLRRIACCPLPFGESGVCLPEPQ